MKKLIYYIVLLLFFGSGIVHKGNAQTSSELVDIPINGTFVVNGMEITASSTGANYSGVNISSCVGVNFGFTSLLAGQATGVFWRIDLKFSEPIKALSIAIGGTGAFNQNIDEEFRFLSNGGTVNVFSNRFCYTTIVGNVIYSGAGAPYPGGSGVFRLTTPLPFTELSIYGIGAQSGSVIALLKDTIIPACGKNPNTLLATEFTTTGISDLKRTGTAWPANIPNGFVAIESKNQGFVITRVRSVGDIPSENWVEGMVVYDITAACVKLFNGNSWHCIEMDCSD